MGSVAGISVNALALCFPSRACATINKEIDWKIKLQMI